MKISIITVCYNSSKTIEKTIQSVLNQTYSNIEYIIVDGKSKDSTIDIIKKYDSKISKWISEPDQGLYDAMNKGVQQASGDIVGILNSDDVFSDKYVLENVAKFHETNTIEASVGDVVYVNKKGENVRKYSSKSWSPDKLKIGFMPPHASIFFERSLFKNFGIYKLDYKIAADYEIITRFFLTNSISWKYSNLITTKMLVGGVSSSGLVSYMLISKEIKKALKENRVAFKSFKIEYRVLWKIKELFNKKNER